MERVALYGPPGTGKTTNFVRKIRQLIDEHGVAPSDITFCSFTKKGAENVLQRANITGLNVGTIHSFCFRICGMSRQQVMEGEALKTFAQEMGWEMSFKNVEDEEEEQLTDADQYLAIYELSRAKLESLDDTYQKSHMPGNFVDFKNFCSEYKSYKDAYGFKDFTDMLEDALDQAPWDTEALFIDEAQDLSPLQWKVINHWMQTTDKVYIGGDDDQAIYVWSGADPQGMTKWEEANEAKRVILNKSYRLPTNILVPCKLTIGNITERVEKDYQPRTSGGTYVEVGSMDMAPFVHGTDTLILYRNHCFRKDVEKVLWQEGVPYKTLSGFPGLLDNKWGRAIKLIIKLKQALHEGNQILLSGQQKNLLARGVRPQFKKYLQENKFDQVLDIYDYDSLVGLPYWAADYFKILEQKHGLDAEPTIKLSSIHSMKGDEADRVILYNNLTKRSHSNYLEDPASEIRTMYVGMSRAREELWVVEGDNPVMEVYRK